MRGKMLFVSIALLVMLFFVETASAQVKVATLEELQAALAGSDETITVTQTIVIDEDLTLDGGGKTVKLDSNARIQLINSATCEHITIDGGELQRSNPCDGSYRQRTETDMRQTVSDHRISAQHQRNPKKRAAHRYQQSYDERINHKRIRK